LPVVLQLCRLRLVVEFDNYRKRTIKEKAELILNGAEKTITAILPILDDMERALKNMDKMEDVAAVKEGVDLIFQKFVKVLGEQGVKKIETENADFNTDLHEAIAQVPAPSDEMKGKIIDCVKTGYTLNEKVIRHSQVAVGL
jgi:molecular chaperone GrpE